MGILFQPYKTNHRGKFPSLKAVTSCTLLPGHHLRLLSGPHLKTVFSTTSVPYQLSESGRLNCRWNWAWAAVLRLDAGDLGFKADVKGTFTFAAQTSRKHRQDRSARHKHCYCTRPSKRIARSHRENFIEEGIGVDHRSLRSGFCDCYGSQ